MLGNIKKFTTGHTNWHTISSFPVYMWFIYFLAKNWPSPAMLTGKNMSSICWLKFFCSRNMKANKILQCLEGWFFPISFLFIYGRISKLLFLHSKKVFFRKFPISRECPTSYIHSVDMKMKVLIHNILTFEDFISSDHENDVYSR